MKARAKTLAGEWIELALREEREGNVIRAVPVIDDAEKLEFVDIGYDFGNAAAGDEGYFIVPQGSQGQDSFITRFEEKEDAEYIAGGASSFLPVFGVKHPKCSFFGRAEGMQELVRFVLTLQNGTYSLFARFQLDGEEPDEELSVFYTLLSYEETDYAKIANLYRAYLLENGICRPIRDRLTPELDYAKDALYIRIRQAWKPVPSPVPEQTEENEPPIHVACDFERVIALMEKCKEKGLKKVQFELVGWNKSGHDGRWPQILPVEPLLGGEEGLKKAIKRSEELGYVLTCHTNSTEIYSIADNFDEGDAILDKDGSVITGQTYWGGGRPRKLCPICALRIAKEELPKVKALGFKGPHYVDVVAIDRLTRCYSKEHPCDFKAAIRAYRELGQLCRELFGGFSSEGARDFILPVLDYGLYLTFRKPEVIQTPLVTRYIPLWQLIYHGICLSNPFTQTVNVTIKPRGSRELLCEYGGRPSFYFYSKFMTDPARDWMGTTDFTCDGEEDLERSVGMLREMEEEYEVLSYLQTEFMVNHEILDGNRVRVSYSDGSVMTVDYENCSVRVEKDGKTVYQRAE